MYRLFGPPAAVLNVYATTTCPAESAATDGFAVFVAPQGTTAGAAALSASIGEFGRAFPVAVVSFGVPGEHSGFARVAGLTGFSNGRAALAGEGFARLAADGRIRLLACFGGASSAGE